MKWLNITFAMVLFLGVIVTGCGPSTQSGLNKEYRVDIVVRDNSHATFRMGVEADTAAEITSGDAPSSQEVESRLTAAWDAAQAQGIEEGKAFIEGVKNFVEKWQDRRDQSTTTTPLPAPPDYSEETGGVVVTPTDDTEITIPELSVIGDMDFHHTQTDPLKEKDGGKSLVLCPDEEMRFDEVYVMLEGVKIDIPWHRIVEDNRPSWWNRAAAPEGSIIGRKDNVFYEFPADSLLTYGQCN